MNKILYKIRHKDTGKFSMGGAYNPHWNNTGKIWKERQHDIAHIKLVMDTSNIDMSRWEIVPYEIIEQMPVEVDVFLSN